MSTAERGWVKTPNGMKPRSARIEQIVVRIIAGDPFPDIAEDFGVTVSYVCHIRMRAGIPRRIKPKGNLST